MNKLAAPIQEAEEALRTLLSTLLGDDPGLTAKAPVELSAEEMQAAAEGRLVLCSDEPRFMVTLDAEWTGLLAEAMLGTPMTAEDEGAADLIQEISAQGYGSVQTALAASGTKLPTASLTCHLPGDAAPLPEATTWAVPFTAQEGALKGIVLLPAVSAEPAPEAAVEDATASAPHASAQAAPTQTAPAQAAQTGSPAPTQAAPAQQAASVAPAAFAELGGENIGGDGGGPGNLGLLAEVELEVTAELGRRRLPLADMLKLTTGSVIELEKLVGEPLAIYANGHLIAEGEAVVIDEQFGIRITNLASKSQRDRAFF